MVTPREKFKLLRRSSPPVTKKETALRRLFTSPRNCDMDDRMKREVIEIVENACSLLSNSETAAQLIKETLDQNYGGSWHAIVGEQFGLYINYDAASLLYMFCGGSLAVCVWKCESTSSPISGPSSSTS